MCDATCISLVSCARFCFFFICVYVLLCMFMSIMDVSLLLGLALLLSALFLDLLTFFCFPFCCIYVHFLYFYMSRISPSSVSHCTYALFFFVLSSHFFSFCSISSLSSCSPLLFPYLSGRDHPKDARPTSKRQTRS